MSEPLSEVEKAALRELGYSEAWLEVGLLDRALLAEQFQRYQTGGPPDAGAFMSSGVCLLRLDREAEAVRQFERALKLDAHFLPALRQLVRVHREAGRLEESERWQARLREIQPEHTGAGSLGEKRMRRGDSL